MAPRHRPLGTGFARLWAASTAGNLGDGIGRVVVALLAARLSRDPVAVATVTALSYVPWLVVGVPAGTLVDRYDRSRLAATAGAVRVSAVVLLALAAATDRASLALLYGVVLVLYTCETVYDNAMTSLVPTVVADRNDLERANGRLQGSRLVAERFVGPPMAGMIFVLAAGYAIGAAAACYAVAVLLLLGMPRRNTSITGPAMAQSRPSLRQEAADGVRYLLRHELHRRLLAVMLWLGFGSAMVNATMVLWVLDELHVPESLYGLYALTTATGALIGSQSAAALARRLGRARALQVAVVVTAVGALVAAATASPYVGGIALAIVGWANVVFNVVNVSLRQRVTPAALLGRVVGGYLSAAIGAMVFGSVLGGALAAIGGLRLPWLLFGLGSLVATVWMLRALDQRTVDRTVAEADAIFDSGAEHVGPHGDKPDETAARAER